MSTRVNFPVARKGNVVVSLLRLGVQLRDVRASGNTSLSFPCWDRSHHAPSG
ncbi:hypothetical protein F511_36726 [Dorcoceras hygrometricum]|uniref:Uncharacterized protein n=1 Tax=Dorcoceras hygrometricum TaxID=472368 RepID=A0A2Z7BBN4_9LAMI|nr:hypothetical protein F511_36726 [Dorcoceras hygrometricum]